MKNPNEKSTDMDFQNKSKTDLIAELVKLRQEFNDLKDQHKQTQFILGERKKELNCLHRISSILSDTNITIESAIHQIVLILPDAWQFP